MASVVAGAPLAQYSCKCLNIRIQPSATDSVPSHLGNDQDWVPLYVGEQGIKIAHPQVTLRNRSREADIEGKPRCARYTSLTCLICEAPVYRVVQVVSPEVDAREGPLLPTEDWVEHEIMKSSSGWVEVHRQSVAGEDVARLEASPDFSPIFSIILPSATPPGSPKPENESEPAQQQQQHSIVEPLPPPPEPAPIPYLETLRPLFLPAPFTPSHPVFVYLASLAEQQSKQIRAEADAFIARIAKQKIEEVNKTEDHLRNQVERLWKTFRQGLNKIEKEITSTKLTSRRSSQSRERAATLGATVPTHGSMVIRDFTPTAVSSVKGPSVTRVSALSASLATTSFHHPRENSNDDVSSPSEDDRSISSRTLASQSYPVHIAVLTADNGEGSNVLQFKRTTNDTINTAVSYKYFRDLEADMARMRQEREKVDEAKRQEAEERRQQTQQRYEERAKKASPSQSATPRNESQVKKPESGEAKTSRQQEAEQPHGKDKGKRKVTFDVEPAVVTIKSEGEAGTEKEGQGAGSSDDVQEMIFEIDEDTTSTTATPDGTAESTPTLPLLEPKPQRPRKLRSQQRPLSGSFATLRPSSLPVPSHMRPPRGHHGVDSARPIISREELQKTLAASQQAREQQPETPIPADKLPLDAQTSDLRKLLAADTPSHRNAWKPGSKALETFLNGAKVNDDEDGMNDQDTSYDRDTFVGSVPIPIPVRAPPPVALSLASYQPNTTLLQQAAPDRLGFSAPTSTKHASSAALRRASYLERERTREMDPGALDFQETIDEDSEGEDEGEEQTSNQAVLDAGERGRKRALKILEVRSKLPEEGMWRSLAS